MSDVQCADLLRFEVLEYRGALHGYFSMAAKLHRLTPERDAAYVSLAYNVGVRGAGHSTATRRLNAGDIAGGWEKAPAGANGYDAIDTEGRRVQIKTNHPSTTIGFRGEADRMLVLHVTKDGS